MPKPKKTIASFTLHVEINDILALWERARETFTMPETRQHIEEIIGTADDPNILGCLAMILDPGDSPPGMTIIDHESEIQQQ